MTGVAGRFWLLVLSLFGSVTATGLLVLAFFFPGQLDAVDSVGYVATALVAVASLGALVWGLTARDGAVLGGLDESERRV